ncbi:MAG: hypothetical protein IPJ07_09230 [Acidobacteria bacterium]|nr:hypothetical protein [Acidobacteriota bacterium]
MKNMNKTLLNSWLIVVISIFLTIPVIGSDDADPQKPSAEKPKPTSTQTSQTASDLQLILWLIWQGLL